MPLLTVGVVACGESGPPSGTATVSDSAGVEIVTNRPVALEHAIAWSHSAEPVLEIGGGATPDVPLFRVTAVRPLDDGRVIVGMETPPQALVFEADGSLASTLGRAGDGPGEFSGVGSLLTIGDSAGIWDPDRRRLSLFTLDGEFQREIDLSDVTPISARSSSGGGMEAGLIHLLPSTGRSVAVFAEGVIPGVPADGISRPEMSSRRISLAGEVLADFGSFPGMTIFNPGGLPLPLGARTHATTSQALFLVGTAVNPEFRVFGPDGGLVRIVRWPDHDRGVGGPFLDRWSAMVSDRPEFRDIVEALPRPERFPAYDGLLSTDAGETLVGEYAGPVGVFPLRRADPKPEGLEPAIPVPPRRWLVFDNGGRLVATLPTPEGFEPYALRGDRMWGVYSDEFDVESVRAYALSRH